MSNNSGLTAEELIKKEALKRIAEYEAGVKEMIRLNRKLETVTDNLASTEATNLKRIAKLQSKHNSITKRRKSLMVELRKQAKLNEQVDKRVGRNQVAYLKLLENIRLEKKRINELDKKSYQKARLKLLEKINAQNKKINELYKKQNTQSKGFISKLRGGLSNIFSPANLAIGAVLAGVRKLYLEVKKTTELLKKLDKIELSMKVGLGGDEKKIERTMGNLYIWSVKYGANLLTLSERYNKFIVASKQSNITLRDTENIFETITKAAGVMGLSNEELKGSLLAIEQMMSKGKITTEELRRQLGERMPGAMAIMAKAAGVNVEELDKMMKKGQVLTKDVLPAFAEAMKEAYNLDSIDKIETIVALQERANTAWIHMIESWEAGKGIMGQFLKDWYATLEKIYKGATYWNEKQKGREFTALGVDDAKKALKKYVSDFKDVLKANGIKGRELSLMISQKEIEYVDKVIGDLRSKFDKMDALLIKKKQEVKNYEDVIKEIDDKTIKKLNKSGAGKTMLGFQKTYLKIAKKTLSSLGFTTKEQEKFLKSTKDYRKLFENYKRLSGTLQVLENIKLGKTSEGVSGLGDAIGSLEYKARKVTMPIKTNFKDLEKSLVPLLNDMAKFFNLDYKNANNYTDKIKALKDELKTRKLILEIEKKSNLEKLKEDKNKSLADIQKQINKNNEIAIKNQNKAQKIIDKLNKSASNYEAKVKEIRQKFSTPELKKANDILKHNKEVVELKYKDELKYYETVFLTKLNDLDRDYQTKKVKGLIDLYSQKLKFGKLDSQIYLNKEIERINLIYGAQIQAHKNNSAKVKSLKEKQEREIFDIKQKWLKKSISNEIKATEILIEEAKKTHKEIRTVYDQNGQPITIEVDVPNESLDKIKALEKELSDLKLKYSEIDLNVKVSSFKTSMQEVNGFLNTYKDTFMNLVNSIGDNIDAGYERDIQKQESALNRLKDYYSKAKELAGDSALKKRLLDEEEEQREKKILKRKKYLERKQLEAHKKFAIFNAIIDGASAVIRILATSDFPASLVLSAMVAATTQQKISKIRKQQIPEYKKGTQHHKGGIALLGDGGVQEVVKEPNKKPFLTPSTPTYMMLKKGTKVYKNKADFLKRQTNYLFNTQPKINRVKQDNYDIKNAIKYGFKDASLNPKINIIIKRNDEYKNFKRI